MTLETYSRYSYMSLCSNDEIDRIFNVSSSEDYLLKMRANAAVEHVRIHRVLLSRMRKLGDSWSFSSHFDKDPFTNYITNLEESDYVTASNTSSGFIFCNKANGSIINTDYGNVIAVSESLRYFLYFMNLAFVDFNDIEVPGDVIGASIKIAIRTMLQTEALDFDMDPRGVIPASIEKALNYHTDMQLGFVIGHEFSHLFLGHLDGSMLIDEELLSIPDATPIYEKVFSHDQKDELAADIDAIERPIFTPEMREDLLNRALFFLAYIDLYQGIKNQISPSYSIAKTHPDPMDRIENLVRHFDGIIDINHENLDNIIGLKNFYKDALMEDVAVNIDTYEFYGSIYLGQWRGKKLVDRIDF